jgi:glycosyltransferase involved in cell wall biosynthesis
MTKPPLVSVIIPAYNRAHFLRDAVSSVLAQDWAPIEIIIVDDGSTDSTVDVANNLAHHSLGVVKVVCRLNGGPGAARQTGVEASGGDFVQFLDSDDLLLPGKLKTQVAALQSDPEADIAYGRTVLEENGQQRHAPEFWSGARCRELFPHVLLGRLWDTSNPLYRRSALQRMGPWAARCQLEDWEYDCRAARFGLKLHFCDVDVDLHRSVADNRLHGAWQSDPRAMRDRIWAHEQVLDHARAAGMGIEHAEFRQFMRSVFLMARIAGARGYAEEAERLFQATRTHGGGSTLELAMFGVLRRGLGWQRAVQLSESLRGFVCR